MSGMANEMAARMAADGYGNDAGVDQGGAADPGTGAAPPPPTPPPAGALNTDTESQGEPGPVPYSRFREVNEAYQTLRGYETLQQYGYDPDSLSRLAGFEAAYVQDPGGVISQLVDNLDLPDEAKTTIKGYLSSDDESEPTAAGSGTPSTPGEIPSSASAVGDEPPPWAKPLIEDYQTRTQTDAEQRENAMRQQALDEVIGHWDEMDKAAGTSRPAREGVKLALIASHASSGRFQTTEELARAARSEWAADREDGQMSGFVPPGSRTGPRSVPGSVATPSPPQKFGSDIKAATRAAKAAIERGELPGLTLGE